jgi:hypothetical protein
METTDNAMVLAQTLIGSGVTLVGTPQLISLNPNQQGIFSGAYAEVGFSNGIVLSTGGVQYIFAPNVSPTESLTGGNGAADVSTGWSTNVDSGLAELEALNGGLSTYDGNALIFRFYVEEDTTIFLNFAFASEEYIDYVNTTFNDVFAFFVDGENIALINGDPVAISTVNPIVNSEYFVNNVANTDGYPVAGRNIRFDGITAVLQAQKFVTAGEHEIAIMIADSGDNAYDSAVFLQAGTFSTTPTPVETPEPSTMALLGLGAIGLATLRGYQRRQKVA